MFRGENEFGFNHQADLFFASPLAFEMFDQDAQSPESGDHTEVISALFAPIHAAVVKAIGSTIDASFYST